MARWHQTRWFRWLMIVTGAALWGANLWQMVRGFRSMDFLQAATAGMIFLLMPVLVCCDWNGRKGSQ